MSLLGLSPWKTNSQRCPAPSRGAWTRRPVPGSPRDEKAREPGSALPGAQPVRYTRPGLLEPASQNRCTRLRGNVPFET